MLNQPIAELEPPMEKLPVPARQGHLLLQPLSRMRATVVRSPLLEVMRHNALKKADKKTIKCQYIYFLTHKKWLIVPEIILIRQS